MFTTRPELQGSFGVVASTHWLATAAGWAILESGGNAFDAAVSAGLCLQVLEPHRAGPGGEVPILFYSAGADTVGVMNGQGPAPANASIDAFRALDLEFVPGVGLLSACVPGSFDAWMRVLGEHGTITVGRALQFAIEYAEVGYPVLPAIARDIRGAEEVFRQEWPSSAEVWLRDGLPATGSRFQNPALAATYRRIVDEAESRSSDRDEQIQGARDVFYRGFVAEAIHDFVTSFGDPDDPETTNRGFLTGDDLAEYRARAELPTSRGYRGHTVYKTGPSTQGPVFLQQLALLEGFDLASMGHNSAEYIHTIVECAKLAFADREAWYGDPDFVDVPMDELLSAEYAAERRPLVGPEASAAPVPGSVAGRDPYVPAALIPGRGTTAVNVVDKDGNLVSACPSGGLLQFSPAIPGLGFSLSERAQAFYLDEAHPNSLVGGKRPRTTLSPSLAARDGRPCMAFSTPGGDRQDQWSLAFFLAHVEYDMNLQEAIDAPLFHSTHWPRSFHPHDAYPKRLLVEASIPADVRKELRRRGHDVVIVDEWSLAWLTAVSREPDTGIVRGAASPREMQAYAIAR